jgi:hypothetical protein
MAHELGLQSRPIQIHRQAHQRVEILKRYGRNMPALQRLQRGQVRARRARKADALEIGVQIELIGHASPPSLACPALRNAPRQTSPPRPIKPSR